MRAQRFRIERHPEGAQAGSAASGVRSNEALGADSRAPRACALANLNIPMFAHSPALVKIKNAHRKTYYARSATGVVRINVFQLCGNVRCTSLNISFLTPCKYCNFLASLEALEYLLRFQFVRASQNVALGYLSLTSKFTRRWKQAKLAVAGRVECRVRGALLG